MLRERERERCDEMLDVRIKIQFKQTYGCFYFISDRRFNVFARHVQ